MKTTRALIWLLALPLFALVLLALPLSTARAADPVIVRVTTAGTTTWPCGQTDWSNPCALQTALTNSVSGYELWVAAGTYKPTAGTDRTATFQLQPGVALYGGFAGSETLRIQRTITANATVLTGDLNGDDNSNLQELEPTRKENSYHVVTGSGVTNTAVLDGFTVTGGNANFLIDFHERGGGMFNKGGSPTLANVTFISNTANWVGGGMHNESGSPTLTNVTFISNTASVGGGMHNDSGSPTLTNVTFSNNYNTAMYNEWYSSPTLTNVTFSNNQTGGMGNTSFSNPTLTNVTFSFNGVYLAGMRNTLYSSPTISNSIFWGYPCNNNPTCEPQIYNDRSTPSVSDSVVQGGCPDSFTTCTRIITADPRLGAQDNYGGSTQTVPLLPGSSAIDAGNDATCAATDQRGISRPQGAHCDIGAFESRHFTLAKTSGDSQATGVNTAFATALRVTVSSASGEPVDGGVVAFTAPSSGPSAIPITSTVTIVSGSVSRSLTANGTLGSYAVIANASGALAPVTFVLNNTLSYLHLPMMRR